MMEGLPASAAGGGGGGKALTRRSHAVTLTRYLTIVNVGYSFDFQASATAFIPRLDGDVATQDLLHVRPEVGVDLARPRVYGTCRGRPSICLRKSTMMRFFFTAACLYADARDGSRLFLAANSACCAGWVSQ